MCRCLKLALSPPDDHILDRPKRVCPCGATFYRKSDDVLPRCSNTALCHDCLQFEGDICHTLFKVLEKYSDKQHI